MASPSSASIRKKEANTEKGPAFLRGFELFGSYAGPCSKPVTLKVGSTSLLLRWQSPQHLGGSEFEVIGHRIWVQYAGSGDFFAHITDTGSIERCVAVESLVPDQWHTFTVAVITAAGVGVQSAPSLPVLTDRAPLLLREVRTATQRAGRLEEQLMRKQRLLLQTAKSSTLNGASRKVPGAGADSDGEAGFATTAAAKATLRDRRQLQKQIATLEVRAAVQKAQLASLSSQQAARDEQRHVELLDPPPSQTPYGGNTKAYRVGSASPDGFPAAACRSSLAASPRWSAGTADDGAGSPGAASWRTPVAALGPQQGAVARRELAEERHHRDVEAYERLFGEEDAAVQVVHTTFVRELVRARLHGALSAHVLKNASHSDELSHYFDLVINRVRSAESHNIFDRYVNSEFFILQSRQADAVLWQVR